MTHESPLPGQVLRDSPLAGYDAEEQKVVDLAHANIITSEVDGKPGVHKPVLDIDLGVKVVPSSTEGHFHLMIDKEMSWDDYQRLLWVLADVGIIEENYASASDERGYTAVRLPWVQKNDRADDGCDCDDCHLEPDGRSRRDHEAQIPCECADCIPSPTHRTQPAPPAVTANVGAIRIDWPQPDPVRGTHLIMDEVRAWPDDPERVRLLRELTQDGNPYYRRGSQ